MVPIARKVILGAVSKSDNFLAFGKIKGIASSLLDKVSGQSSHSVVVGIGLVGLQGGEFGAVRGIHAFVTEVTVHLEDAIHATDDCALEVDLGCNTQIEVHIQRIHMRDEGTCRSATVDDLEHRSFELDVITAEEVLTNGTVHCSANTDHIARGRTGDQIELAAADSLIFRKSNFFTLGGRPCLRQRTQRL